MTSQNVQHLRTIFFYRNFYDDDSERKIVARFERLRVLKRIDHQNVRIKFSVDSTECLRITYTF